MGLMSDDELERLRRRRLAQLQNRLLDGREEQVDSENKGKEGKEDLLRRVFVGRAWEVFQATQKQYPQVAKRLGEVLAQLVSSGKISQVSGQELYSFLRKSGLRVKLKTRIRIQEHGKLKSLEEKLKEQNKK